MCRCNIVSTTVHVHVHATHMQDKDSDITDMKRTIAFKEAELDKLVCKIMHWEAILKVSLVNCRVRSTKSCSKGWKKDSSTLRES